MFDAITTVQDGVSLLSTGQDWTADRAEGLITATVTSEETERHTNKNYTTAAGKYELYF